MILAIWDEDKKSYEFAQFKDSKEAWISASLCSAMVAGIFFSAVYSFFL